MSALLRQPAGFEGLMLGAENAHHPSLPSRSLAAIHIVCVSSVSASVAVSRDFTTARSPDPRMSSTSHRGSWKAPSTTLPPDTHASVATEGAPFGFRDQRGELDVLGRPRQESLQVSGR